MCGFLLDMGVCVYLFATKQRRQVSANSSQCISFSLGVCVFGPLLGIWCACLFYPVYSDHRKLLWYIDIFSLFLYSSMIIPDFFPRMQLQEISSYTEKSQCIFLRLDSFIFFIHHSMHSMTDFIWLSACVGCWIELPVSWCLWQCYIVINVAELLTHCLGIYTIFFSFVSSKSR